MVILVRFRAIRPVLYGLTPSELDTTVRKNSSTAATSVLGLAQAAVLVYSAVVVNHLWLKLVTTLSGAAE